MLFDAVVVPQLRLRLKSEGDATYRDSIRVIPTAKDGIPAMIHKPREGDRNHYWDDPVNRLRPDAVELKFVGFFNWGVLEMRDYQFYEVKILRFSGHPELEGRRALIEVSHAALSVVSDQTQASHEHL